MACPHPSELCELHKMTEYSVTCPISTVPYLMSAVVLSLSSGGRFRVLSLGTQVYISSTLPLEIINVTCWFGVWFGL
jgi:hypothetical protein